MKDEQEEDGFEMDGSTLRNSSGGGSLTARARAGSLFMNSVSSQIMS